MNNMSYLAEKYLVWLFIIAIGCSTQFKGFPSGKYGNSIYLNTDEVGDSEIEKLLLGENSHITELTVRGNVTLSSLGKYLALLPEVKVLDVQGRLNDVMIKDNANCPASFRQIKELAINADAIDDLGESNCQVLFSKVQHLEIRKAKRMSWRGVLQFDPDVVTFLQVRADRNLDRIVPQEIQYFEKLDRLSLSGFYNFPIDYVLPFRLNHLDIRNNFFKSIENLEMVLATGSNISTLQLINSGLDQVPDNVWNMKKMEFLQVTPNNQVRDISDGVLELTSLKYLFFCGDSLKADFDYSIFEQLPDSMKHLTIPTATPESTFSFLKDKYKNTGLVLREECHVDITY